METTFLGTDSPQPETDLSATQDVETESFNETPTESEYQETETTVEPLFEVDGTPITLDEARNGYLRQSDYTRKTQELAEQRRQVQSAEVLQAALARDPQATLKALADAYGVQINPQPVASTPAPDQGWWDEDANSGESGSVSDPRLDELVQWRQEQEIAAAQARIQTELSTLENQYGKFNETEVLQFALNNGFPDVTTAFKALHFDQVQAELAKRQEETKRVQAKREAQVVSQAGSRPGSASAGVPQGGLTIRDAWLAAKKDHGF